MSDANLDRRRAEVAREQAESAQRALGQYFVAAEAQRVNTSELEALEAELDGRIYPFRSMPLVRPLLRAEKENRRPRRPAGRSTSERS